MTDLPTETFDGFAAWCPKYGFDIHTFRTTGGVLLSERDRLKDWRIVPVTITITATAPAVTAGQP